MMKLRRSIPNPLRTEVIVDENNGAKGCLFDIEFRIAYSPTWSCVDYYLPGLQRAVARLKAQVAVWQIDMALAVADWRSGLAPDCPGPPKYRGVKFPVGRLRWMQDLCGVSEDWRHDELDGDAFTFGHHVGDARGFYWFDDGRGMWVACLRDRPNCRAEGPTPEEASGKVYDMIQQGLDA